MISRIVALTFFETLASRTISPSSLDHGSVLLLVKTTLNDATLMQEGIDAFLKQT